MEDVNYKYKIGFRTRILNVFRIFFQNSKFEKWLVARTIGKPINNFWCKVIPPAYTYQNNSIRSVERDSINYILDISNVMDHSAYFGYVDGSHDFLINLAQNNDVIFDVGSNIGTTTLPFAKVINDGTIYSFEPDKTNFKRIFENIKLNPSLVSKIKLINIGIGSEKGKGNLYKVDDNNPGMNRILPSGIFKFEEIEIDTLDNFVIENNIIKLDLIKIDVEGYELEVLKGAVNTLKKHKPKLFIEIDDDNLKGNGVSAKELISFVSKLKYSCYNVLTNDIVTENYNFEHCHFDIFCNYK